MGWYRVMKQVKRFRRETEMRFNLLSERANVMSKEFDDLTAAVAKITSKADSLIALVKGLSAMLMGLKDDPAKIEALALELDAKADEAQAAVDANTPPAP